MLNRDAILATDTKAVETAVVPTPEWGGEINVRRLTVLELERWWEVVNDINAGKTAPAGKNGTAVLMGAVNPDGTRLFDVEKDGPWLGEKAHPQTVANIANQILRMSGVIDEVKADKAKKPETMTNSSSDGSQTNGESGTSES